MPATPSLPSMMHSLRHDVPLWIAPLPHRAPPPHPLLIGSAGTFGAAARRARRAAVLSPVGPRAARRGLAMEGPPPNPSPCSETARAQEPGSSACQGDAP